MIEADLSMPDFAKRFDNNTIGNLHFPNGKCGQKAKWVRDVITSPFYINLRELYTPITVWKVNHIEVPLEDIVGVIAFGPAVKYPGHEVVRKTSKKYFLFGPEVTERKKIKIQPDYANFLVITTKNIEERENTIAPVYFETNDEYEFIEKGGIHIVNKRIETVVKGIKTKDKVIISAMEKGIPIFYDKDALSEIQSNLGIKRKTPMKLYWGDNNGYLDGKILNTSKIS